MSHRARTRETRQRRVVYETIKSTHSHPTADWIFEKVRAEVPKISLGTVYRNLSVLKDEGAIREPRELEVLEVGVSHPSLSATFEAVNERRTKITITHSGETRAERETTALSIRTSKPDDPQLQVPVEIYRLRRSTTQNLQTSP